jgi:hypothetical protein
MRSEKLLFGCLVAVIFNLIAATAGAQPAVVRSDEIANQVVVRNVTVRDNSITGEVVNNSSYAVQGLQLLIQYHWLWNNEMHPGGNPPGAATYVTLDRTLRPGETAPFTANLDPSLQPRSDGRYMPEVSLAGFSQIIPQSALTIR